MGGRKRCVHVTFGIVAGGGFAEFESAGVAFGHAHHCINLLGHFARTQDEQTRCQRVERSCVTDLVFFIFEQPCESRTEFVHDIKRRPFQRFVDEKNAPFGLQIIDDGLREFADYFVVHCMKKPIRFGASYRFYFIKLIFVND